MRNKKELSLKQQAIIDLAIKNNSKKGSDKIKENNAYRSFNAYQVIL